MLDRYLAFEEPVSRWAKLRKAVTRLGKRNSHEKSTKGVDAANIGNLSQLAQDLAFSATFGASAYTSNSTSATATAASSQAYEESLPTECLMVTLFLAIEEINRYSRLLFDSWLSSVGGTAWSATKVTNNADAKPVVDSVDMRSEIAELAKHASISFGLEASQEQWLHHCLLSSPDWRILFEPGPWQADTRCQFLTHLLVEFKGRFDGTTFNTAFRLTELKELFLSIEKQWRSSLPGGFLPRALLLVEGQTESVLVPSFGKCLDFDLDAHGVNLLSSGGAKQVLKRFLQLSSTCTLPIVCVLDADAIEQADLLKEHLRETDRLIHLEGEIEDAFNAKRMVFFLNQYAKANGLEQGITMSEIEDTKSKSRTDSLNRLWRRRGQSSFDKIGFALVVADGMRDESDVPDDGRKIVEAVKEVLHAR